MNRLKLLREQAKMTQTELGKLLNVKDAAISKYESEKVPLTGETLLKLSEIFDVSIDYILGNEEKKDKKNKDEKIPNTLFYEKPVSTFYRKSQSKSKKSNTSFYNTAMSKESLSELAAENEADFLNYVEYNLIVGNLQMLSKREQTIIDVFRKLNEDNQDIIIGEMKKYLKDQLHEEAVSSSIK